MMPIIVVTLNTTQNQTALKMMHISSKWLWWVKSCDNLLVVPPIVQVLAFPVPFTIFVTVTIWIEGAVTPALIVGKVTVFIGVAIRTPLAVVILYLWLIIRVCLCGAIFNWNWTEIPIKLESMKCPKIILKLAKCFYPLPPALLGYRSNKDGNKIGGSELVEGPILVEGPRDTLLTGDCKCQETEWEHEEGGPAPLREHFPLAQSEDDDDGGRRPKRGRDWNIIVRAFSRLSGATDRSISLLSALFDIGNLHFVGRNVRDKNAIRGRAGISYFCVERIRERVHVSASQIQCGNHKSVTAMFVFRIRVQMGWIRERPHSYVNMAPRLLRGSSAQWSSPNRKWIRLFSATERRMKWPGKEKER